MKRLLTKTQQGKLCMFMRVIDYVDAFKETLQHNSEAMKEYHALKEYVAEIVAQLSEEEKFMLMERYESEKEFLKAQKQTQSALNFLKR